MQRTWDLRCRDRENQRTPADNEIFRYLPKQLDTRRAKAAEPLNTHVNVCTRASTDPVNVGRTRAIRKGPSSRTHARTAEIRYAGDQLRSDRTQSQSRCAQSVRDDNRPFHRALVLFFARFFWRSLGMGSDNYPLPTLVQIRVLPS